MTNQRIPDEKPLMPEVKLTSGQLIREVFPARVVRRIRRETGLDKQEREEPGSENSE